VRSRALLLPAPHHILGTAPPAERDAQFGESEATVTCHPFMLTTAVKSKHEIEDDNEDIAFVGDLVPMSDDDVSFRTENMYDNVVVPEQGYW
jgi:hypothetical protein